MTTPDQSVRKRRRWRVAVAALAASGLVLASGLLWLTRSETGSAWLLARVPGLTLAGSRGSLAGGAFAAERIELRMGSRTLSVQRLAWRDADWSWRPHDGAWIGLTLVEPRAEQVVVAGTPSPDPPALPTTLRLPQYA